MLYRFLLDDVATKKQPPLPLRSPGHSPKERPANEHEETLLSPDFNRPKTISYLMPLTPMSPQPSAGITAGGNFVPMPMSPVSPMTPQMKFGFGGHRLSARPGSSRLTM